MENVSEVKKDLLGQSGEAAPEGKLKKFGRWLKHTDLVKNWGLYLLLLPAIVFIIIFAYIPMVGIVIAFEKFDPIAGMFASEWVGFTNFKFFFNGSAWLQITVNTIYLNLIFIITGTIAAILVAVIMSEIKKSVFSKAAQTCMTLPNFISWTSIALFSVAFLSSDGVINQIIHAFGGKGISFYTDPDVWPTTFVLIRTWKSAGWSAIVYMATILGIDSQIYEAARIDGASRVQCIFRITLPLIKNMVVLMTIMAVGNIFRGDFGMIYPFIGDNPLLYNTTDVIDTYVFRALRTSTDYGRTAAIGLYQSLMGFALVIGANALAKRYSPDAAIF